MTFKNLLKKTFKFTVLTLLLLLSLVSLTLLYFHWQSGQRETFSASQLAPQSGRYVSSMGSEIFIQEAGPADGQAVLLVHGTGAWSETWKPTMAVLAKGGFHAIAIDLPPFGFSRRDTISDFSKVTQGLRIVGVIEALNLQNVLLVGHSFGGGPTMEAALHSPGKIRGVVLVDAALSVSPLNEKVEFYPQGSLFRMLSFTGMRNAIVATFLTNPLFTHRLLTLFIDNPVHATDEWVARYRQPLVVQGSTTSVSIWLPELLSPLRVAPSERPSSYAKITFPLHLIWGERDSITPLGQALYIEKIAPTSRLRVIPGVGHIPQIEAADIFNHLLLSELKSSQPISPDGE
jgi:pimeloyl-ACP methyl ester carboxylesterase